MILIIMSTNFNYLMSGKITAKPEPTPTPGPAPGPAPEEKEEEEEEEEEKEEPPVTQQPKGKPKGVKTTVVADIKMVDKLPNKSKTTVVADIKMVNKLPAGIIKKETYIGYSYI
jgi:hypothetical protein